MDPIGHKGGVIAALLKNGAGKPYISAFFHKTGPCSSGGGRGTQAGPPGGGRGLQTHCSNDTELNADCLS